jgi:hypothetical protein
MLDQKVSDLLVLPPTSTMKRGGLIKTDILNVNVASGEHQPIGEVFVARTGSEV